MLQLETVIAYYLIGISCMITYVLLYSSSETRLYVVSDDKRGKVLLLWSLGTILITQVGGKIAPKLAHIVLET